MTWYRIAKRDEKMEEPTQDMIDFFEKRTKEHIDRAIDAAKEIVEAGKFGKELIERTKKHDASKYGDEERVPYIWITDYYKHVNKGEDYTYPPGIEEKTKAASGNHIKKNRHHPEAHDSPKDMTNLDIAEMICDWESMSREKGGSTKEWADDNVGKKWKFTDKQKDLIYDLISVFEG